jgi:mercuric ion transport protein
MNLVLVRWREALTGATPVAVLGTLVCCALPIALVSLGAGSVVVSLVSAAPWLAALTRNKEWVFLFAGLMLAANYWALYRSGRACQPGGICHSSHPVGRWMRRLYWGSVAAYGIGFVSAYLSLPLAKLLGY